MMSRIFILLGCIFAGLSVALGAFGAHVLRFRLEEYYVDIFQTGVEYQMSHALGLILIGIILKYISDSKLVVAGGWLLLLGIFLFSFSLYAITFTGIRQFGMIAPFGGTSFVIGWLLLGIGVFIRYRKKE